MELKQIKELMTAMEKAGVKKLTIKEKTGYEIHLERQEDHAHSTALGTSQNALFAHPTFRPYEQHAHFPLPQQVAPQPAPASPTVPEKTEAAAGKFITSPMVGTFYRTPSPEDPPFVKVGDKVDEGTVVCIVEAMKVMNEVKAGVSGVIAEICLDNGHPVEFGSKLFRIV